MDEKILLRPATEEDALFVAMVVAEALDDDIMEQYEKAGNQIPESRRERIEMIESVVRHPDTLYTWRHVTVATKCDGTLVGAIVAYAGDDYAQRRDVTFDMLSALIKGSFDPEKMDPETQAGDYYLDSLAVMPSCRGKGVARMLLQSRIDYANSLGRPAILACSPDNQGAKHLYEALGFRDTHIYSLFGHPYWRMINE